MPATETLCCTVKDCPHPRADQDPSATNRHCYEHRRESQRKYVESAMEKQEGKGFVKGVAAMRVILSDEFEMQGSAAFSGYEIAALIRRAPGPLPEKS